MKITISRMDRLTGRVLVGEKVSGSTLLECLTKFFDDGQDDDTLPPQRTAEYFDHIKQQVDETTYRVKGLCADYTIEIEQ